MDQQHRKRPFPWMVITLIALACTIAWRMASMSSGADGEHASTDPVLQVGMTIAPSHEGYACSTPELAGQMTVYQVVGAKDKLRGLLDHGECARTTPQKRFKVMALKEKLTQVAEVGVSSATTLWMPTRDLVPLAP